MRKDLTESEFLNTGIKVSDYRQKDIETAKNLKEKLSEFYESNILFTVYDETFEFCNVYLKHEYLSLKIIYSSSDKKYYIYCDDMRLLPHTTSYTAEEVKRICKLEEPKNIGVITTKKIQEWVSYYEILYEKVKQVNDTNKKKIDDFRESLKPFNVNWYRGKNAGSIKMNGLEYSFTIEPTSYCEKIELSYRTKQDLKTFLLLADNKINFF